MVRRRNRHPGRQQSVTNGQTDPLHTLQHQAQQPVTQAICYAIAFRATPEQSGFPSQYLPVGQAMMLVQLTVPRISGDYVELVLGVKSRYNNVNGTVAWDHVSLAHDLMRKPYPGARARTLDPLPEPQGRGGWLRLAQSARSHRRVVRGLLPTVPRMPAIQVGFKVRPVKSLHTVEFEKHVVQFARMLNKDLSALGPEAREQLAQQAWDALISAPRYNGTVYHLVPIEYLPRGMHGDILLEDYSELLGVWRPNPVNQTSAENPTRRVLRRLGIEKLDESLTQERLDEIVTAMREALGPIAAYVTREEIEGAIVAPREPLVFQYRPRTVAERATFAQAVLPHGMVDLFTAQDLQTAALEPAQPVRASRECRLQAIMMAPRVAISSAFYVPESVLQLRRVFNIAEAVEQELLYVPGGVGAGEVDSDPGDASDLVVADELRQE